MNRLDWINEMRREAEERYDTWWAPTYAEKWGTYSNTSHLEFIRKFLSRLPRQSKILDAACGAGRYFSNLLDEGHIVMGIDQSQGMLASAKARYPNVEVEKVGLQEMTFSNVFDGVVCMDAMEHVFPEDWPLVLDNFHRALKPQGNLYFTVEIADEREIEAAFIKGQQSGLPVVYGEMEASDVYHYYPSMIQVREWIQQTDFTVIEEGEGDDYHHFIVRGES
jgi:2-polyprenyl-3-methyl-5-hydroxy-6-metoxy-1,4-benzoquinol methylase